MLKVCDYCGERVSSDKIKFCKSCDSSEKRKFVFEENNKIRTAAGLTPLPR